MSQASGRGLVGSALCANKEMYLGYFALVMATGIVSTALLLTGQEILSQLLFVVNLVAYSVLLAATVLRIARFGGRVWADLTHPRTLFLSFTFVAATNVLGVQFTVRGYAVAAEALWVVGAAAWLVLGYVCFGALTFKNDRTPEASINASWLVAIVGTQSVAVLGTMLAPDFGALRVGLLVGMCGLWGIGIALYGVFITFVIYRLFFVKLDPADMLPPYWIILGATAISALAGAGLLAASRQAAFLAEIRPMIEGLTILLWAWSSWWIPMLVVFGFWRHVVRKDPLRYHPSFWSLVFPLGMYTVATSRVAAAAHLAPLEKIPPVMVWAALLAWGVTMTGLLRSIFHWLLQTRGRVEAVGGPLGDLKRQQVEHE